MSGFLSGRTSLTTVQTADIANDAITLAKLAGGTDGNIISFDASGDPVAIATGDDGQALHSAGAGAQPAFETISAGFTLATEQAVTSGTGVTFGSIPAGVKHIDIMFHEVSTSSTTAGDDILVTLGDAGGLETSGYLSVSGSQEGGGNYLSTVNDTAGFGLTTLAAQVTESEQNISGVMSFYLEDSANFSWVSTGVFKQGHHSGSGNHLAFSGGSKSLSAELTQLKVGIEDGTFDAGAINIKYQ